MVKKLLFFLVFTSSYAQLCPIQFLKLNDSPLVHGNLSVDLKYFKKIVINLPIVINKKEEKNLILLNNKIIKKLFNELKTKLVIKKTSSLNTFQSIFSIFFKKTKYSTLTIDVKKSLEEKSLSNNLKIILNTLNDEEVSSLVIDFLLPLKYKSKVQGLSNKYKSNIRLGISSTYSLFSLSKIDEVFKHELGHSNIQKQLKAGNNLLFSGTLGKRVNKKNNMIVPEEIMLMPDTIIWDLEESKNQLRDLKSFIDYSMLFIHQLDLQISSSTLLANININKNFISIEKQTKVFDTLQFASLLFSDEKNIIVRVIPMLKDNDLDREKYLKLVDIYEKGLYLTSARLLYLLQESNYIGNLIKLNKILEEIEFKNEVSLNKVEENIFKNIIDQSIIILDQANDIIKESNEKFSKKVSKLQKQLF